MIKLFASDMDGTLLTNHVEVHKNNIQAIRKVQNRGNTLSFVLDAIIFKPISHSNKQNYTFLSLR